MAVFCQIFGSPLTNQFPPLHPYWWSRSPYWWSRNPLSATVIQAIDSERGSIWSHGFNHFGLPRSENQLVSIIVDGFGLILFNPKENHQSIAIETANLFATIRNSCTVNAPSPLRSAYVSSNVVVVRPSFRPSSSSVFRASFAVSVSSCRRFACWTNWF